MKTHKGDIVIQRLDERRCVIAVDGVVRYVGTQEECERRVAIRDPHPPKSFLPFSFLYDEWSWAALQKLRFRFGILI